MYWTSPFDSFRDVSRLFESMDRLTNQAGTVSKGSAYPRMNAWSNEDGLLLTLEIPGIDPAGVDLTIVDNKLTISGSFPSHERGENESCRRNERRAGKFSREVTLPFRPEGSQVTAKGEHGLLTVTIPKPEAEKPRKIAVNAA